MYFKAQVSFNLSDFQNLNSGGKKIAVIFIGLT